MWSVALMSIGFMCHNISSGAGVVSIIEQQHFTVTGRASIPNGRQRQQRKQQREDERARLQGLRRAGSEA